MHQLGKNHCDSLHPEGISYTAHNNTPGWSTIILLNDSQRKEQTMNHEVRLPSIPQHEARNKKEAEVVLISPRWPQEEAEQYMNPYMKLYMNLNYHKYLDYMKMCLCVCESSGIGHYWCEEECRFQRYETCLS